ncbi:MAG: invasin domain 3-containing protein [bacterium]
MQIMNRLRKTSGTMQSFVLGLAALALLALLAMTATPASAASITWGTATTITGDSDVSTNGTFKYAYHWNAANQTVNGVTFTGTTSTNAGGSDVGLAGFDAQYDAFTGSTTPFTGLSTAYKATLAGSPYNGGAAVTVTLKNLTNGKQYAVQVWVEDARIYGQDRKATLTAGNSVTLDYNSKDTSNANGGVGQYSIGTFTADAATQTFTITGVAGSGNGAGASALLNALQVRELPPAAPNVSVTAPANGQVFLTGSSVTATVTVANGTMPYTVTFYTNSAVAWTNSASTNLFTIDLGVLAIGTYTNFATVTDSAAPTNATATSATNTFAVVTVSAANSTVAASPTSVTADGSTTSTITVTLKDAGNQPVTNKTVTLAKTSGPGTPVITTVSGTTDTNGVATFTVKSTTAGVDVFTATDTTDGVTVTQTATVTFTVGAVNAGTSTVAAAPTSVQADGSTTSTITVTLKDAYNNPVAGKTVTLVSSRVAEDTISAASGTSSVSGVVTFTVTSTTAGSSVFTATGDGVLLTPTATVTFGPSAAASTVAAAPSSVTADGSTTSTITVTLKDAGNQPVTNKTVTLAKTSGPGTPVITTVSGTTDTNGVATFTVTSTTAGADVFTATDTTDGVTVTPTATVTFTAGAVSAGTSTVAASPTSVTADGATPSTITVTLKDGNNNPVSGKTVSLAHTSGPGSPVILSTTLIPIDLRPVATTAVTASSTYTDYLPEYVSDWSDMTGTFPDGPDGIDAWQWSSDGNQDPSLDWIAWDLGATYTLGKVHVWNDNSYANGIKTVDIEVSSDGITWTKTAYTGVSWPDAPGTADYAGFDQMFSTPITTRYIRFANFVSYGGYGLNYVGLDEVVFYYTTNSNVTDASGHATFTVTSTTLGADVFTATDDTDNIPITPTATVNFVTDVVIYSDDFIGGTIGTDLNGSAPDVRRGSYGGSASATWSATTGDWLFNGAGASSTKNDKNMAYLPFAPQPSSVYILDWTWTQTSSSPWWLIGGSVSYYVAPDFAWGSGIVGSNHAVVTITTDDTTGFTAHTVCNGISLTARDKAGTRASITSIGFMTQASASGTTMTSMSLTYAPATPPAPKGTLIIIF